MDMNKPFSSIYCSYLMAIDVLGMKDEFGRVPSSGSFKSSGRNAIHFLCVLGGFELFPPFWCEALFNDDFEGHLSFRKEP